MSISLWTNETEAHVFLCDGKHPPKSNCYWINLSNTSKKNVIRRCQKGTISHKADEILAHPCNENESNSTEVNLHVTYKCPYFGLVFSLTLIISFYAYPL